MTRNVGIDEMTIRFVAGMALIVLGLAGVLAGGWATAGYLVGAVAVITGLVGYCPLWALVGVNTLRAEQSLASQGSFHQDQV